MFSQEFRVTRRRLHAQDLSKVSMIALSYFYQAHRVEPDEDYENPSSLVNPGREYG